MLKKLVLIIAVVMLASEALAELPVPEPMDGNMILGQVTGDYSAEIELYYESDNGAELSAVTRSIYVPEGSSLVEAALGELFSPAADLEDFISSMPGDASVRSVETDNGLVTVDLAVDVAGIQDGRELVSMYTAIANTVTGIEGVEAVNILVNSRQESIAGIPTGVIGYSDSSTAAGWSRYQAEAANFIGSNQTQLPLERTVALYFPSANGQWLLPDVRQVYFPDADYASQLMLELVSGTMQGNAYANFLSGGVSIMTSEPVISVTAAGERVLDVYLSGTSRDYMLLQGLSEWQLSGAITMTMCSFIPELDAVRINIDGGSITQLNVRGQQKEFINGLMHRSDFSMYVGSVGTLYFADGEGNLQAISRAMSSVRAASAYSLVTQLIAGPSSADGGAIQVMPVGADAYDLLGVSVRDGTAIVNMSANFYRLCQALNEAEERILVYSMVNTLCTLPGVDAVRIHIEGQQVETLANSIYLMGELLPNPGLVK